MKAVVQWYNLQLNGCAVTVSWMKLVANCCCNCNFIEANAPWLKSFWGEKSPTVFPKYLGFDGGFLGSCFVCVHLCAWATRKRMIGIFLGKKNYYFFFFKHCWVHLVQIWFYPSWFKCFKNEVRKKGSFTLIKRALGSISKSHRVAYHLSLSSRLELVLKGKASEIKRAAVKLGSYNSVSFC